MHLESTLTGNKKFSGIRTILLKPTPETTFEPMQLERTMLLVLLPLFAVACVALGLADVVMDQATWFERYQLVPMAIGFMAIWYWCAHTRSSQIHRIRIATLILAPGIVFERFVLGLSLTLQNGYQTHYLSSMSVWMILASCLFVFLIPGKRAFMLGFAYYIVATLLILLFLAVNSHPLPDALTQEFVVSYIVGAPIFLVMIAGFSRLRMAYGTALTRVTDFENMAMQDGLTGLFNRRVFAASMRRARSRQARRKTPVSMMMLDLDKFKAINDTYGHEKGDQVLVKVAKILTDTMRRTDDVIRWGGEEFVILMEETGAEAAGQVADRLRALIEAADIIKGRAVTASFGVTELRPGENDTEFFNRADSALYDAKDMGRNRVVVRKAAKRPSDPRVGPIAEMIDSTRF
jgi:diguanylate cyclase (GGDEF)-like protein